jgi:ABC-type transporter MlaC component
MKKPLTVTLHIGGKEVETLTEAQREAMAKRLSESMSRYFSNNLAEFAKIKND